MQPQRHVFAGLVSRLAALVIDVWLLVAATLGIASFPTLAWEQLVERQAPDWLTAGSALLAALLPWAYFTLCWWLTGQTLGDLLIGLTVQRPNGAAPLLVQAAARAALGLLFAPLWLVGLVMVLWDQRRRALHDRVFRTVVRYAAAE